MKRKKPDSQDNEKVVVAAAINNKEYFLTLAKIVRKAEMFRSFAHQVIWRACYRMHREGSPFDVMSLHDTLLREKDGNEIPRHYLVELYESAGATCPHWHAAKVVESYARRMAKEALAKAVDEIDDVAVEPADVMDRVKADLDKVKADSLSVHAEAEEEDVDPSFVPFPVNALPACIADYVMAGSAALRCDPAFLAVPCLVATGAAIINSREIELKATWHEPAIFWAAIVADSGSMKSPSLDMAFAPLWKIQEAMSEEFQKQWDQYRIDLEEWNERRYKKRGKGGADDDEPKPVKPVPKKIVVGDITVEKLAHVLYENPHGVCLYRDELSGWFSSFGRYSDGNASGGDMALWLQLFGGRKLIVDRKTSDPPSIMISRASVCVGGSIQPAILQRQLTSDFFDSGIVSRLLLCMPCRKGKAWTEEVIPMEVYNAYANCLADVYYSGEEILDASGNQPKRIGFTPKGKEEWIAFYEAWAKKQRDAEGEYVYALAKLEAYCARFCLLLAVVDKHEWPGKEEAVTEIHVRKAFALVEWFAAEADRVYHRLRTPADQQQRERLVELIKERGGVITASELRRTNRKRYLTTDDAEKALAGLVEKGLGTWGMKLSTEKGGKPTKAFQLLLPLTGDTTNYQKLG